jgi:hypothetical protein
MKRKNSITKLSPNRTECKTREEYDRAIHVLKMYCTMRMMVTMPAIDGAGHLVGYRPLEVDDSSMYLAPANKPHASTREKARRLRQRKS